MRQYRWTFIGAGFSIALFWFLHWRDWDWFERLTLWLRRYDRYEVDEILLCFAILTGFCFVDLNLRKRLAEIEVEKAAIYRAMLTSTQHVLNNFLNKMQLFKFTAEEIPDFPREVLTKYDQISQEATAQVKALNEITRIDPEVIADSVAPKGENGLA